MLEERSSTGLKEDRFGVAGLDRSNPRPRECEFRTTERRMVGRESCSQAKRTVQDLSEMMETVRSQLDKALYKTNELKDCMEYKNSEDEANYWKQQFEERDHECNEIKTKLQFLQNEQSNPSETSHWRKRAEDLERENDKLKIMIHELESEYNEMKGKQKANDGEHEYLIQHYQQKVEEAQEMCSRVARESSDMKEHVSVLQAQLLIYKDDFENERRDREKTQGKCVDLEKQVKHLESLLRQQQSSPHRYPVTITAGRDVTDGCVEESSPAAPILICRGPSDVTDCKPTHRTTSPTTVNGSSSYRNPIVQESPFQTDSAALEVDDFDLYLSELASNLLPKPSACTPLTGRTGTDSSPSFCRTSAPTSPPKSSTTISLMEDTYPPVLVARTCNPNTTGRLVPLSATTNITAHRGVVGNSGTTGYINTWRSNITHRNKVDELLRCTKCYKEFTLDEHFELMEHMDECGN